MDRPRSLEGLLARLEPELREILAGLAIPPSKWQELVTETLILYFHKQGQISNPEVWIPHMLRIRCRRYRRDP